MATITISVRDVDLDVWKEFQKRIIDIHGSLYGHLGIEVTKALQLWLKENKPPKRQERKKYIILNTGKSHTVKGAPYLKTLLDEGLWGLKKRYRKQWERIDKGDIVLIYSNRGIRAKGKIVDKMYEKEPVAEWDNPYEYPYRIKIELDDVTSKSKLPEIKIPLSELEAKKVFPVSRLPIKVIEEPHEVSAVEELLKEIGWTT